MSDNILPMWTVYKHPRDYPDKFVARRFEARKGEVIPTHNIIVADTLERLREVLEIDMHLVCLTRNKEDDPVIVETWL